MKDKFCNGCLKFKPEDSMQKHGKRLICVACCELANARRMNAMRKKFDGQKGPAFTEQNATNGRANQARKHYAAGKIPEFAKR